MSESTAASITHEREQRTAEMRQPEIGIEIFAFLPASDVLEALKKFDAAEQPKRLSYLIEDACGDRSP